MDDQTPEIQIILKPDGTSTITAVGFVGQDCHQATHPYEKSLGVILSDTPTDEIEPIHVRRQEEITRKA